LTEVLSVKNHLKHLFPQLTEGDINKLEEAGKSFISHANCPVVQQDESCNGVLILINGKAKISIDEKGKPNIIQFLKPGDTFYTHEAFLNLNCKSSCICMETSLIYILPTQSIKELTSTNPQFMMNIMNMASKESELIQHRATNLISLPVKFRFIDSLLTLIKKFGEDKIDHFYIPIKRDEIGSYINASKASLSRIVTELEGSNIIQTSRKGIKIFDWEALTSIQA